MSDDSEFEPGLETKSLASGYEAMLKHGDGTATSFWGATEDEAERKALEGST